MKEFYSPIVKKNKSLVDKNGVYTLLRFYADIEAVCSGMMEGTGVPRKKHQHLASER